MENSQWFALHVRPRFEPIVSSHLLKREIDHYSPSRRITRETTSGTRSIDVPLLPKYILCKAHPVMHRALLMIPGVLDIAGRGGADSTISEQQINDLKRIVDTGLAVQPWPFTPSGKRVTVGNGPLKGVSGILSDTSSTRLLIVSITPIQRSLAVDVGQHYTFSAGAGVGTAA